VILPVCLLLFAVCQNSIDFGKNLFVRLLLRLFLLQLLVADVLAGFLGSCGSIQFYGN